MIPRIRIGRLCYSIVLKMSKTLVGDWMVAGEAWHCCLFPSPSIFKRVLIIEMSGVLDGMVYWEDGIFTSKSINYRNHRNQQTYRLP
jgi:hypothetical protein